MQCCNCYTILANSKRKHDKYRKTYDCILALTKSKGYCKTRKPRQVQLAILGGVERRTATKVEVTLAKLVAMGVR